MHILVNDFIGGALDRGMPLYVRNLIDGLVEEGFRVSVVRAPRICRRLPRGLFYLIAVLIEQALLPLLGLIWRADLALYPYNSIAILDLLTRRGRIVVHDLEQLNRALSPSKAYFLVCYRAIKWLDRPVFTVSNLSRTRIRRSGLFGSGPVTILPNTFYAFEHLLRAAAPLREPKNSLLLCTGSTANKDLDGIIADYLPMLLGRGFSVALFGLHKAADAERFGAFSAYLDSGRLRLCARLSDSEVVAEYRRHEIVWVHALREGFGRCVVEGRLAGSRVICTAIPEFAELQDDDVHLYRDAADFMTVLERLVATDTPIGVYGGYRYRELLRSAIDEGL